MNRLLLPIAILFLTGCTSSFNLSEYVRSWSDDYQVSGRLYVSYEGEVLYSGVCNGSPEIVVPGPDDPVALASLTKLFTAHLVRAAIEEGRLEEDTRLSEVFPEYDSLFHRELTIASLLNMRSGLPRELSEEGQVRVRFSEDGRAEDFLPVLAGLESDEPNVSKNYSNLNYWILGLVLERVYQIPLDQILERQIFTPAAMRHVGINIGAEGVSRGYVQYDGRWTRDTAIYSGRYASGGMYASMNDLISLSQFLREGRSSLLDTTIAYYGSLPSASNVFYLNPGSDLVIIFLAPAGLPDLDAIPQMVGQISAGLTGETPERKKQVVSLQPIEELSDSINVEYGLKRWAPKVESGTASEIYEAMVPYFKPGSLDADDPVWGELAGLRDRYTGFRCAGFRWIEEGVPSGVELWFVTDEGPKIALMWTMDRSEMRAENIFIKPDDMEFLGEKF